MTEVKEDKRKKTSSKNLAKARQAKLEKLKQEKISNASKYEIIDDESDSDYSSDEDAIVIKTKKKQAKKPVQTQTEDPIKKELAELREMLNNITVKKARKPKPKRSKQVIQIVNPQPEAKKLNPETELIKQRMLLNFN